MLLIVLVQGFCPLKSKIKQIRGGFHLKIFLASKVCSTSYPGVAGSEVDIGQENI